MPDATGGSFQPPVSYIPERVKDLRVDQRDICWRPSSDWKNVCIKPIGHAGQCGWDKHRPELREDDRGELRELIGAAVLYSVPGYMPVPEVRALIERLVDISTDRGPDGR